MTLSGCVADEDRLVELARDRIKQEAAEHPIYNTYLEAWSRSRSRGTRALDEYCRQVQQ